jgi:hypothetical protein
MYISTVLKKTNVPLASSFASFVRDLGPRSMVHGDEGPILDAPIQPSWVHFKALGLFCHNFCFAYRVLCGEAKGYGAIDNINGSEFQR